MKKAIPLIFVLFIIIACTISIPTSSFQGDISTQVALAFTETALQSTLDSGDATISPAAPHETQTPTATQTPPADDPKTILGDPDWQDDLSSGKNWSLLDGKKEIGNTTFSVADGKLTAVNSFEYNWWLSYFSFKNAYLEAIINLEDCSENDQYGLVIRAQDYEDGIAYYYTVTCGGKYGLRRETAGGSTSLVELTSSEAINSGSNQTNALGIWMEDSLIRLYMNNQFLAEIDDANLQVDGHFGLFIYSTQTNGFTLHMDDIAYWLLDN